MNTSRLAAALLAMGLGLALGSQAWAAGPLHDPSVSDLVDALAGDDDDGPSARRLDFRPTASPEVNTHRCAGSTAEVRAGGRNLVVSYVPDAPGVDLALHFETGSDRLSAHDRALLDRLASALQTDTLRDARFAIAGHTDATGSERVNRPLSCARAIAAREYLIERGVAADRLTAYGFGSSRPIERHLQESARNRRVEIRRGDS